MTDFASALASVSASVWEANIDANASTLFAVPSCVEQYSSPSSYAEFCNAMSVRGEISNLSVAIRNFNVSSEPCSVFGINKPSFSKWKKVKSALKSALNLEELDHVESKV